MSGLIQCVYDGKAFVPQTPFQARRAEERFGAGEVVLVEVENERSGKSHRHYFATLHDLWATLPERYAMEQWAQSSEHLRKYALIKCGYSLSATHPCATAAEAMRWAAFVRPIDEFSVVLAQGTTVVRYVAKSQSVKAMPGGEFQRSKVAVLEWIEDLLAQERGAA